MGTQATTLNEQGPTAAMKRHTLSAFPMPQSAAKGKLYFSMKQVYGRKPTYDDKFESNYNGTLWSDPTLKGFVRFYLQDAVNVANNTAGHFELYMTHYCKLYDRYDFDTYALEEENPQDQLTGVTAVNEDPV